MKRERNNTILHLDRGCVTCNTYGTCHTRRWHVVLFGFSEAARKTVKTEKPYYLSRTSSRSETAPDKEAAAKGSTAGAMGRSRREISLPRLHELVINTFPPGTFSIPAAVRSPGLLKAPQSFGRSKPQKLRELRPRDINPITFWIFTLDMLPIRPGSNCSRCLKWEN